MGEIASASQLRMSFVRWALVTIPLILLLGTGSGILANSGYDNRWFASLNQPALMPPGWVFGAVWTVLYIAMGCALALVLGARGARGRTAALALFFIQLILNLIWSPVFFLMHQVTLALVIILIMILIVGATAVAFWKVRPLAGVLLIPYLIWLCFAAYLNYAVMQANPEAEHLEASDAGTQIEL